MTTYKIYIRLISWFTSRNFLRKLRYIATASKVRITVSNNMTITCKEPVAAYFKTVSRQFPGETKVNQENFTE